MAASEDFAAVCRRASEALEGCEGYFLERVSADTARADGCVDIFLRLGPSAPDVMVSLTGVVWTSMGAVLDMDAAFVDEIRVKHVPGSDPSWPEGLSGPGARPPGFPDVAWLTVEGPVPVEVVAKTITVFVAQVY